MSPRRANSPIVNIATPSSSLSLCESQALQPKGRCKLALSLMPSSLLGQTVAHSLRRDATNEQAAQRLSGPSNGVPNWPARPTRAAVPLGLAFRSALPECPRPVTMAHGPPFATELALSGGSRRRNTYANLSVSPTRTVPGSLTSAPTARQPPRSRLIVRSTSRSRSTPPA
jgi:hypothetical protein